MTTESMRRALVPAAAAPAASAGRLPRAYQSLGVAALRLKLCCLINMLFVDVLLGGLGGFLGARPGAGNTLREQPGNPTLSLVCQGFVV